MRAKELAFNPVRFSPQLLGIIGVAHRSPVHVVTLTRRDTPFHFFPLRGQCTLLGNLRVFISSLHQIPPSSRCDLADTLLALLELSPVRSRILFLPRFLVHILHAPRVYFLFYYPVQLMRWRRNRRPCLCLISFCSVSIVLPLYRYDIKCDLNPKFPVLPRRTSPLAVRATSTKNAGQE